MADYLPLTESERKQLTEQIELRRRELQEKRKLLQTLQGGAGGSAAPSSGAGGGSPTASALLSRVMAAVSEANAAAAPETPEEAAVPAAATAAGGTAARNVTYSKALRRVVGALQQVAGAVEVSIAPVQLNTFDKSIQCGTPEAAAAAPAAAPSETQQQQRAAAAAEEPPAPSKEDEEALDGAAKPAAAAAQQHLVQPTTPAAALTEDEKKKLLFDPKFDAFFEEAARVVEKELSGAEYFGAYSAAVAAGAEEAGTRTEQLVSLGTYSDAQWSKGRALIDLAVHPKYHEVMLASYSAKEQNESNTHAEGCALIWNLSMQNRPEYALSSQSPVTSAIFDPYRAHIAIGGTYSGRISLWDTRTKTTRPQQRTPLTQKGHRHPVYCMALVGTENAHSPVSLDGDGRLCVWSLAMLSQPTESLDLKIRGREIRPSCFSFCSTDTNRLLIGADDGNVYSTQLHGSQAGVLEVFATHRSPVSDVHWAPKHDWTDKSNHLILSSSFDWTCKLWNARGGPSLMHSFDVFEDYVSCVQWHPRNPYVFAAGQVNGTTRIWNLLNKGFDIPAVSVAPSNAAAPMSKIRWSSDGQRLAVGDAAGVITLWGVTPELNQQPRQEVLARWEDTIATYKA